MAELNEEVKNSKEELKQKNGRIKSLETELAARDSLIDRLKNELKQATNAEETSKKAMDELAIALKEVAKESNQVKEESEQLKDMVRRNEERYRKVIDEAKKEAELNRNTVERLRLEAEESSLAWNDKEIGFVKWIKATEEEKAVVEEDLKAAETLAKLAKDEIFKLRDILKQAISEANAAKAAADIAREENSLLKDFLSGKDEALLILNKENERLRINGVAAKDNLKEFNHENEDDQDSAGETTKPKDPAMESAIFYSNNSSEFELRAPTAAPVIPDEGRLNSEHASVDSPRLHNSDTGRHNLRRKKALFHRVSDLIMKKKMVH